MADTAASSSPKPVYLLLGEDSFQRAAHLRQLKEAHLPDAIAGLNEDDFQAGEADVGAVLGAARTLPMMARRRWVLVRDLDRWDGAKSDKAPLDQLADYLDSPVESTILVLIATKLNARRKLVARAKRLGYLLSCDPLKRAALPGWIESAAARRGCKIERGAADLLAEVAGPELARLDEVVERLCLFVGESGAITEESISELIPVVKPATVWQLLDSLAQGQIGRTLSHLAKVYDPQDRGLRLVGTLAWSTRQLIRYQEARRNGLNSGEAARAAGVPPFKADSMERQARRVNSALLADWLRALRDLDLDLKGGSQRHPRATLEATLIQLCRQSRAPG